MTATWTTPRTWVTGEVVTAALANEQWRDNLEWLKSRPFGIYTNMAASQSTSSTVLVAVTSVSVTITTTGGRVMLLCNGGVWDSGAFSTRLDLAVDGVRQGDASDGLFMTSAIADTQLANTSFSLAFVTAELSAASHTFQLYWSTSGGTLNLDRVHLAAFEV